MKKSLLSICLLIVMAGCGQVDWFPDAKSSTTSTSSTSTNPSTPAATSTETVTASAGGNYTQNGVNKSVTLEGSGTSSKGTALTYSWSVTSTNATSAKLDTPNASSTTFTATTVGTYTVQLKVASATTPTIFKTDTATIKVINLISVESVTALILNGTQTLAGIGSTNEVTLNGSVDFAIGPVTIAWSVTSDNAASAHFGASAGKNTTFYADTPGTYKIQLLVSSPAPGSNTSTATGVITVPEPALGTADGYFPMLPVGRTWTYTYNNGGSTEIIKAADTTTLKHTLGTVTSSDIFSFPSTGGVLLTSISADTTTSLYVPGLPIFPVNIVAGSAAKPTSYTVTVSGTTPIEHTVTLTVAGVEATRTVPAGTFNNVLHIHTANIPSGEGTLKADSWYARGVGLIEDTDKKLSVYIDSTGISHP